MSFQMFTSISFPTFGIEINPARSFSIGPLTVHYYGLLIACGMLLAVIYGYRRVREFGIKQDDLIDGVLWVVPFAVLCARAFYCIFSWESGGYSANPISVLYIWEGGLAIYGGVLGAAVGVTVYAKCKRLSLPALLDLVSLGFLIGQCIGRWGNFFNREAFGEATDSFMRMGLLNAFTGKYEYYHPTFLYESVWNAIGFILLHNLSKHRKYDGQVALGYATWYGLGRALIEGLRTDSLYWGDVRVNQVLAAVSCMIAAILLIFFATRKSERKPLFVERVALELARQAEQQTVQPIMPVEESTEEPAEESTEELSEEPVEEPVEEQVQAEE